MAEELRAAPDVLSQVGVQLANHGETLLALQRSCREAADAARPGWIGSSAGALAGLLERWGATAIAHIGRFGEHACGMHLAATGLTEMDQRNAASLMSPSDGPTR
ncbi:hypothetical protein [Mycobacterium kubicae]|uniref:hypothetical protein n=1 Tax=Mycobacterium kubicae TaxID=120959 RepID=UPI001F600934|nr:hypothetical protein [Mycobacterium kubicae]